MTTWERTHGRARGAYMTVGSTRLYVRQMLGKDGVPTARWELFVDGRLEGTADGEATARAAAELAVRCMLDAQVTSGETAAA